MTKKMKIKKETTSYAQLLQSTAIEVLAPLYSVKKEIATRREKQTVMQDFLK